jgi:hypothetical protein
MDKDIKEISSKTVDRIGDYQIDEVILEDETNGMLIKWYKIFVLEHGFLGGRYPFFVAHQPTLELAQQAVFNTPAGQYSNKRK